MKESVIYNMGMKLLQGCVLSMAMILSAWAVPEGKVDINQADAQELAQVLVGVGESRANAIVEYRQQHGEFEQLMDLLAVRGIGSKVLEDNAERIVLSD